MTGKGSSSPPPPAMQQKAQSPAGVMFDADKLQNLPTLSDSDDDFGREYLIQTHTQKRQKVLDDEDAFTTVSEGTEMGTKTSELFVVKPGTDGSSRRKDRRGRGDSAGKDCGSKVADLARPTANSHTNEQLESATPKEKRLQELLDDALEEISLLCEKVASLEEIVRASRHKAVANQQIFYELELDLKESKDVH